MAFSPFQNSVSRHCYKSIVIQCIIIIKLINIIKIIIPVTRSCFSLLSYCMNIILSFEINNDTSWIPLARTEYAMANNTITNIMSTAIPPIEADIIMAILMLIGSSGITVPVI